MSAIAASASKLASGCLFQAMGPLMALLPISATAAAAMAVLRIFVPETKPAEFDK